MLYRLVVRRPAAFLMTNDAHSVLSGLEVSARIRLHESSALATVLAIDEVCVDDSRAHRGRIDLQWRVKSEMSPSTVAAGLK